MLLDSATLLLPDGEPGPALDLLRALCRPGARARLLAQVSPEFSWGLDPWSRLEEALGAAEARLAEAAAALPGLAVETDTTYGLDPEALDTQALIFPGPPAPGLAAAALRAGVLVGWPGARPAGLTRVAVPWWREPRRALPAVALLSERLPASSVVLFAAIAPAGPLPEPRDLAELLGWGEPPEVYDLPLDRGKIWRWAEAAGVGLAAVAVPEGPGLEMLLRLDIPPDQPCPVLLIPGSAPLLELREALEVPDLLALEGRLLGSAVRVGVRGAAPLSGAKIALVHGGAVVAELPVEAGQIDAPLPPDLPPQVAISADLERPLVNLEGFARVIRPGTARVALFDAAQDPTPWRAHAAGRLWWAITLSDQVRAAEVRARAPQLDAVLSASAILRDGHPDDLPPGSAPLRLVRVARQLRAAGVAVELVVGEVQGRGFAALPGPTLAATPPRALGQIVADCWRPPCAADDLGARLEELTGAAPDAAEGVDFVLDNRAARQGLLELIAGAQRSVHLQIYIFENGAVGEAVVRALLAAAERGVAVRVLVDSLYSLHGSLGQENPVLAPLEAHPRVQLRSSRPVAELADLKLRDHRKLIVVDDRLARVSGRNVGATYYTGFDEVALTPETPYRDVPWLDAGVEVTGPVVATIGATFRAAWLRAGGDDFPASAPCGEPRLPVRFVSHEGMADAHTLDAYRALIASARTQITVVNTFPLQFELQRALLRALERGVEVRFLVGNVRPLFGARRPFPGGQLRDLANEIIHGRLDALVDAGARAFEFALQPLPGWAPGLARVLPHVHAKLVSVDGRVCTVGSANLDITAGYWESEALLVIEDPATVRRLDARLEAILRGSEPVDPEDPAWRDRARRRAWLSRNWPSLLG